MDILARLWHAGCIRGGQRLAPDHESGDVCCGATAPAPAARVVRYSREGGRRAMTKQENATKDSKLAAALMREARLIPVLTVTDAAKAVSLAQALVAGGVRMLEVTLRTAAGADCARAIRDEV